MRIAFLLLGLLFTGTSVAQAPQPSTFRWTKFVTVEGQPEPVPAEWVSTPEGAFAHSIKIPNPVPRDSGYRPGMTSEQYFEHLCKTEAGEFIYKTVENIEGFYFARPPKRPTDDQLMARYELEAPDIERTFQLLSATPEERGTVFINPPWAGYLFVEEPTAAGPSKQVRISGYRQNFSVMRAEPVGELSSRYGLTWRGIRRPNDRDLTIAGNEWIVIDLMTQEVLAVQRNYVRTGGVRRTTEGIWWLNAVSCPAQKRQTIFSDRFYDFVSKSMKPVLGGKP